MISKGTWWLVGAQVALVLTPSVEAQFCGKVHPDEKLQQGRSITRIFIPYDQPPSAFFEKFACLFRKAAENWNSTCDARQTPNLVVFRGDRPPGNFSDISVAGVASQGENAIWNPSTNTVTLNTNANVLGPPTPLTWECDPEDGNSAINRKWFEDVVTHELGHAIGLAHADCTPLDVQPSQPLGRSIMTEVPPLGPLKPNAIWPQHCEAVEAVNKCEDPPGTPPSQQQCCFYCNIPLWRDLCDSLQLPISCGGPIFPPQGEACVHTVHRVRVSFNITYTAIVNGVFTERVEVAERTYRSSDTHCFPIDIPSKSRNSSLEGDGPLVFVRSEFSEGAFGWAKISGFARDDEHGVLDLAFWVDGNPIDLADLRRNLHDEYTCSEIPAPDCDPFSRFEGYLNTQSLSDGQHTLQIIATNNHPASPIPTFYETTFMVDNSCTDGAKPNVSLVNPGSGSAVQGSVTVAANATDGSGVDRVLYYVDDVYAGLNYGPPFHWEWETEGVADGTHTLKAKAVDRCGLSRYSAPVTVTVANSGCADTTPPEVTLTAPGDGATVSGSTPFSATASDASGIEKVVFYVDGTFFRSDTTAPYTSNWDSTTVADGSHILQTRTVDLCGRAAWSNQVSVQTDNGQPITLQFTPTDDAWVSQDEPDRVFGPYNFLRIRTAAGGHGRHAYLKFTVNGIDGPVTSVKLRLRTQETEIPSMGVFRMTDSSWTEETLTWNNASLAQDSHWGDFSTWQGDTWRDLDLPGAVAGNGIYTFGLATSLPYGLMDLWSKEAGAYVPVLEITYTPSL